MSRKGKAKGKGRETTVSCGRGPSRAVGPGGLARCMCCGEIVPLEEGESCADLKCPKCDTKMVRC
jgi:Zn finger protein HypA/HybF involved in hydrogenase expression